MESLSLSLSLYGGWVRGELVSLVESLVTFLGLSFYCSSYFTG